MEQKMRNIFVIITLAAITIFSIGNMTAKDNVSGSSAGDFLKVGAAGAQFLKIGVGARASGMGGAYTAVANDLTSLYWNPAGLAKVRGMTGEFHYTQWFAGFTHSYAALAMPIGDNFTAAAQMISFNSDKIPVTTLAQPEGTGSHYSINDFAAGLSFSGYLTDQFTFGVTAKMINNAFSALSADGFAFDIGTTYETGIQGIKLGFAIFNLGTQMKYEGQDLKTTMKLIEELKASPWDVSFLANPYPMPLIFRAGISSEVVDMEDHNLIVAGDFITLSDVPEQFAVGLEYTWLELLSLRAGYTFGHEQLGLSGGIGVTYLTGGVMGRFDYSITPTANLGLINRLSIAVGLD
jgi:hypothetical protein